MLQKADEQAMGIDGAVMEGMSGRCYKICYFSNFLLSLLDSLCKFWLCLLGKQFENAEKKCV